MNKIAKFAIITGLMFAMGPISASEKKTKDGEKSVVSNAPTSFPKQSKEEVEAGCKTAWPKGPKKEIDNCIKYITERMKK